MHWGILINFKLPDDLTYQIKNDSASRCLEFPSQHYVFKGEQLLLIATTVTFIYLLEFRVVKACVTIKTSYIGLYVTKRKIPVSYTHLDVYKRQDFRHVELSCNSGIGAPGDILASEVDVICKMV